MDRWCRSVFARHGVQTWVAIDFRVFCFVGHGIMAPFIGSLLEVNGTTERAYYLRITIFRVAEKSPADRE